MAGWAEETADRRGPNVLVATGSGPSSRGRKTPKPDPRNPLAKFFVTRIFWILILVRKTEWAADAKSDVSEAAKSAEPARSAQDEGDAPGTRSRGRASSKSSLGPPHPQGWGTLFARNREQPQSPRGPAAHKLFYSIPWKQAILGRGARKEVDRTFFSLTLEEIVGTDECARSSGPYCLGATVNGIETVSISIVR